MWLAAGLLASVALAQVDGVEPAGQRIELPDKATLFISSDYRPSNQQVDLVLHLHGTPKVVEPAFVAAGWHTRAVLITFNRAGLSSIYTQPFGDPELLDHLIANGLAAIKAAGLIGEPRLGTLVVSSFSAGFGGVRELLKTPRHCDRINAIVLADSLYAGYAGDAADRRIDPEKMAGFKRFATAAAQGKKAMLVTHSAQVPAGYASTTETADDLIRTLGAEVTLSKLDWGDGWVQTRRCVRGRFLVLGFAGTEGADHMRHLRGIGRIWRELPEPFAQQSGPK